MMTRERVARLIPLRGGDQIQPVPRPVEDRPLLSQRDAAKRMGIGTETLKALIEAGTIYAIPIGQSGKHRRVPVAEVEKWRRGTYDHRAPDSLPG